MIKKTSFYQPEITLPIESIKRDLTRTAGITILALILQLVLAVYLVRGGWQKILPKMQQIMISERR